MGWSLFILFERANSDFRFSSESVWKQVESLAETFQDTDSSPKPLRNFDLRLCMPLPSIRPQEFNSPHMPEEPHTLESNVVRMTINTHCPRAKNMKMDRAIFFLVFCSLWFQGLASPSLGQGVFNPLFPPQPSEEPDPTFQHLRRLPRDPLAETALFRAKEAIENGQVAEGLEALQTILNDSEDSFQTIGMEISGSTKHAIELIIAEHAEDYERLFGAEAMQQYETAISSQDLNALAEVGRRFRSTKGGQLARSQWAALSVDRGEIGAAVREIAGTARFSGGNDLNAKVKRAATLMAMSGNPSRAEAILQDFEGVNLDLASLAKSPVLPPSEAEIFEWRIPSGNEAHIGSSRFTPVMFSDAWSQPLIDQYDFFLGNAAKEKALLDDAQSFARSTESSLWSHYSQTVFPAGRSLIVGNRVIVPSYGTIKSYNLETGEIDGVGVNIDQTFKYLHEYTSGPSLANDEHREKVRNLFFAVRGWRDLTSASLSTDGKYVYAVSDTQLVGTVDREFLNRSTQRHELVPQPFNQLHAFELNAGLRNRWSIGTVDENAYTPFQQDEEIGREIFFYGAPTPVGDQLFAIGEERGQIQLYELDRETGSVLWSLGLLNSDKEIVLDERRRLAGLMPAYLDGLLICPTGEGVITAVDPFLRQVVWTHQYEETRRIVQNQMMFRRGLRSRGQTVSQSKDRLLDDDRWFDSKVVQAGRLVIHTPPDSDELVCLNISDGSRVWEKPLFRQRLLYVAGVYRESLIVVGRSEVAALDLEDGSHIWSASIPRPSGRGVRMGDQFVQPLMTGEVAIIDLKNGRQLARSQMPGQQIIGNLSTAHGRLVAQSGTAILAFKSSQEVEEMLATLSETSKKLAIQGELLLQKGERDEAMSLLDSIDPDALTPRAKTVLGWAKIDGLHSDFEAHRSEIASIEKLLTTEEQTFTFLLTRANGLKESGDHIGALKNYLQLFESLVRKATLRDLDGLQEVSDQRWTLAQLEALYESVPMDQRAAFIAEIQQWLESTSNEIAVLDFLRMSSFELVPAKQALSQLLQITARPQNAGDLSQIYSRLSSALDPAISQVANQELARLALLLKDGSTADHYLKLLEHQDVKASDSDLSSAEMAAAIRNEEQWDELFNSVPRWPDQVTESDQQKKFTKAARHQIPHVGPESVPLQGWTFFLNHMGSQIDIYDEHGRRQTQLPTRIASLRIPVGSSIGRYVSTHGHLALIVLADRFLLLDFQHRKDSPRLIASQNLVAEEQNPLGAPGVINPNQQQPTTGFRTFLSMTSTGTPAGNVGAIGTSTLSFGLGTQLTTIDPLTGKVQWRRYDFDSGSEIFSDDEFVLTLAPNEDHLRVIRASDGMDLGTRPIPQGAIASNLERLNGDWGRYFPTIQETEETIRFAMVDPVSEESLWSFEAPSGSIWCTVSQRDIAFLAPDQTLTILDGLTGEQKVQRKIPVGEEVISMTILKRPNQWIVLPGTGEPVQYDYSYPSRITRTIEKTVAGKVVAINELTGEVEWSQEIEDQHMCTQTPSAWPILFFGKSYGNSIRGLILNRLTGEKVIQEQFEYDRTWIHWQSSVQPMQIWIAYGRKTVSLDCLERLGDAEEAPKEE